MIYCRRLIGCRDFDVRSRVYLLLYVSYYIVCRPGVELGE